jgi:formylglycine-generating enzyme required for sulfatase activity
MKKLLVLGLAILLAGGCVDAPEPWKPDGNTDTVPDSRSRKADGKGEIGASDVKLPDAALDVMVIEVVEVVATDIPVEIKDISPEAGEVTLDVQADTEGGEICQPQCGEKECGDDGCGGSCGNCGSMGKCEHDLGTCSAAMVQVPSGEFWMGCNKWPGSSINEACEANNLPYHPVELDNYYVDRTEVTNVQFAAFLNWLDAQGQSGNCGGQPCLDPDADDADLKLVKTTGTWMPKKEVVNQWPIVTVTWYGGKDYCEFVGKRLCTEAEWEKAARGGCSWYEAQGMSCKEDEQNWPWGNTIPTCEIAAMAGCPGYEVSVCSYSPSGDSPDGICDMAGNVREWVNDYYQADYYCMGALATGETACSQSDDWPGSPGAWGNPQGPQAALERSVRGGSFYWGSPHQLRSSHRYSGLPSNGTHDLGFRCCSSTCESNCFGKECGDDGCGGSCGKCPGDTICSLGSCCQPQCDGKECGDDGCGGSCGTCAEWEECNEDVGTCAASMVEIPPGPFWMGCNKSLDECIDVELPYHEVQLDAYWVDATEVTVSQYGGCVDHGPCLPPEPGNGCNWAEEGSSQHPVNCVAWALADNYCSWVGKSLCSEAQWEKAARGGCEWYEGQGKDCQQSSMAYPWGDVWTGLCDQELAAISPCLCDGGLCPVATHPNGVSPYGVHDLSGNALEWVDDWYGSDYYCTGLGADTSPDSGWAICGDEESWFGWPEAQTNPTGPLGGQERALRGGSVYTGNPIRVAFRYHKNPGYVFNSTGFRCCRSE